MPSCGCSIFNEEYFYTPFFPPFFFFYSNTLSSWWNRRNKNQHAHPELLLCLWISQRATGNRHLSRKYLFLSSFYRFGPHSICPCSILIYDSQWKSTQTKGSMLFWTPVHAATPGFDRQQMVCYTVIYCCFAGGAVLYASLSFFSFSLLNN